MRTLIINLLATALLLFGASSASAFALSMSLNPGSVGTTGIVAASDLVIVDVYLDADPGLGFLTVGVEYDDDGILAYEPGLSTMPTYILYTGGKGATYLVPNASPPLSWPGVQQPGKQQVNIDYLEQALGSATASGTNIWLATLVFHVTGVGDGSTTVTLTLANPSAIVEAYTVNVTGSTTTTGSFTFLTTVPEPTTALLIGFGLVGLALAGRRSD